jgi:hypothetical protein
MSRRSTGQVIERSGPRGKVFALRFQAYGERRYLTLGSPAEGWTRRRAREEMDNIHADVRRGIWVWRRRARTALGERRVTKFGPFASRLVAERKGEVSDSQLANQEWTLVHLLPYFADWQLEDIDIEAVTPTAITRCRRPRRGVRRSSCVGPCERERPHPATALCRFDQQGDRHLAMGPLDRARIQVGHRERRRREAAPTEGAPKAPGPPGHGRADRSPDRRGRRSGS